MSANQIYLGIKDGPISRDSPTLHIVHNFGSEFLVADHTHSLRTALLPQLIRQQGHVWFSLLSGIPDDCLGVRSSDTVNDFLAKGFFRVRRGP